VRLEEIERVVEKLQELEHTCPGLDRYYDVYSERVRIEQESQLVVEGEVKLYRHVWRKLGEEIWGSLDIHDEPNPDRAVYLKLAQIIALISLMRYRLRVYKNLKVVVEGRSGIGKTTYSILSLYGALRILGLDSDESWWLTSRLTFMSPIDFAYLMLYAVKKGVYIPCVILDEAGLQLSKYWLWLGREARLAFSALFEMLDLVKDYVGVLILTSPTHENIAKRLRDICDFIVPGDEYVEKSIGYTVWALTRKSLLYYETYSYPHRKILKKAKLDYSVLTVDVTPTSIRLPREIWRRHLEDRKRYIEKRLTAFIKYYRKLQEKIEAMLTGREEEVEEVELEELIEQP